MDKKTDSPLRKLSRLFARAWIWIPLAIGVLAVVVLIALPYGIRYGAQRWLVSQGASQVLIEDVDLNLFTGRLALRNVQVKVGKEQTLLLPQANIRFALVPLLHKQVVINDLYLRDTSVTIEQTADNRWRFIGLGGTAATPGRVSDNKAGWRFALRHAEVDNSEVRYKSAALAGTAHIEHGEATLSAFTETNGASKIDDARIRLDGKLHVEHARSGVIAESRLSVDVTATPPPQASGAWRIAGAGQFRNIRINWPDGQLRVASAERLDFDGLNVTGSEQIAVRALGISGLTIAKSSVQEESPAALDVTRLQATDIRFVPEHTLDIAGVSARGLRVMAQYEAGNRWYGFEQLRVLQRALAKTGKPSPPLVVRIGTIALDDPGLIELSDRTVTPVFRASITLTGMRLTHLDTGNSPAQAGELALSARIGKYTTAEVHGQFRTFAPQLDASLAAKLREIELPVLSTYASKMFGYRIVSGQLNGDVELKIANGRLEGKNKLALANLGMTPKDETAAEQLKARLTVPLESALAMLRDKNNNVKLEVDISGNTSDPKFDLTDAINQALTKALRTASVSYLKYFFQPYGTLITVAELAGKTQQLRLDPVPFPPGTATAAPEAQDYLARVAKLLQERKNLRIKLCGKTVPKDGVSEGEAQALATRRAEGLKDYFAGQYGIATDRLFLCEPGFDQDAEATPRVELLL